MGSGMRKPLLAAVCLVVGAAACNGEDGPAGPEGPPGNANVGSGTATLASADWLWNSQWSLESAAGSTTSWFSRYVDIPDALITQDIVDDGAVLVYFKPVEGQTFWTPLPFAFVAFGSQYYHQFHYRYDVGNIRLHYFWTPNGGGTVPSGLSTYAIPDHTFRWVVIAGFTATAMRRDNVPLHDYEAVMRYLAPR